MFGKEYFDNAAYFDDGRLVVSDKDVATYTKKHMHFFDRFNIRRVVECAMYSFSILSKSVEEPRNKNPKKNWFYYDKDTVYWRKTE